MRNVPFTCFARAMASASPRVDVELPSTGTRILLIIAAPWFRRKIDRETTLGSNLF
jgi:hypothetical protein